MVSTKSENLRPTKERIKESLFDILQFRIAGSSFLDLFGGTGQIGLEAFSRHAQRVTIVDNRDDSIKIIKNNISKIKSDHKNLQVLKSDCIDFIRTTNIKYDIAFLDPPYKEVELLDRCLESIHAIMNEDSVVITESLIIGDVAKIFSHLRLRKKYKYGKIVLDLYKYVK